MRKVDVATSGGGERPGRVEVLVVNGYGDRDGVVPIGLIQAVNQLGATKKGILYHELATEPLEHVKVVVLHLHWDVNFRYFPALVRHLRRHAPTAAIVVGGFLSTVHAARLVRDFAIDYCLVRDYELPFKELVEALLAGRTRDWIFEHVPNLVGRERSSRNDFRMVPAMLNDLDGLTIDWFPSLEKFVAFQDLLNELGDAKWSEEQYFPAIIIKGSFNRMCSYCTLSTQNFRRFCTKSEYTYLEEEQFVRILDACARQEWRGVNVFGDFCGLDLDKILKLLDGKKYGFELTLGDLFKRIDDERLLALADHFKKVWATFSVLPLACYLGKKKITLSLFDVERDRALFDAVSRRDDLVVAYWINSKNLAAEDDFSVYDGHIRRIDPWLPYPTQEPTEDDYRALVRRSRAHERRDREVRQVSVYLRRTKPQTRRSKFAFSHDPFTAENASILANPVWHQDWKKCRMRSTLASRAGAGVRSARFSVKVGREGLDLEAILFERGVNRRHKQRYLTIRFPARRAVYDVELRIGRNIVVARVLDEDGELVASELVVFTLQDLRNGPDLAAVQRVQALHAASAAP